VKKMAIGNESATEFNINSGLEENRPTDPVSGSVYLATDTENMYVCYENGVWQLASPIKTESDNTLTMNGKQLYIIDYDVSSLLASGNNGGLGAGDYSLGYTFDEGILPTDCVISYSLLNLTTGFTENFYCQVSVNGGDAVTLGNLNFTAPGGGNNSKTVEFPYTFNASDVVSMKFLRISGNASSRYLAIRLEAAEPIRRPVYVSE
jgi:hypothetical protein